MPAPTIAPARENACHRFDQFELDVAAFELRSGGRPIAMEPQVFEVLALLVQHHERVVTKDEILDAVWPERYVTEAALNSRVMSARKALGDDGRTQRYIKTVHGRGYRFVGDVAPDAESPPREQATVAQALTPQTSWHQALPAPSTTFIGRETELSRLAELLVAGGRPLVTVVGPGGIGKTRLAIAAASRLQTPERPVAYVSLEPVTAASQLPGAVAAALGLKPSTPDTAAELLGRLAGTRLLLMLDNFEQIAKDAAPFLSRLLAAAPGVQVLVTSRVVLGLVEEWVFRVEGLAFSDESGRAEAHQLFLERASQANAAAAPPSGDDYRAIADIVRLVDGMPLAIELAASLTPYLPYTEIASLLARDPGCLASEAQNATPRHRDMRALLEESCRRLDPRQQRALQSLSAFDGPFGAAAAAGVAGASLPLLRQLVDRSLVQPVAGRFTLHPLMRQFTRERCGDELEELRRRQAEYYSGFLAARRDALNGRGQVEATREIEAEFTNVAASWRWAATHGRIDLIDAAAYPLFCYLTFRARFFEAEELASIAVEAVARAGTAHADALGGLLMHHFWVLSRLGRTRAALTTLGRINELFADGRQPRPGIGLDPRMAVAVVQIGAGNYAAGAAAAIPALESARERGDESATAFAAWLAGISRLREARLEWAAVEPDRFAYRPSGDEKHRHALDDAARFSGLAARILESAGETWLRGYVEIERGLIAKAFGDPSAAMDHFRAACELRRAIGDPQGTANALIYLSDTLLNRDTIEETAALHAEATALFSRVGDASGLTEAERLAGGIAVVRGDFEAAMLHFSRTLELSADIGFANNVISAVQGMARILQLTGRLEPSAVLNAFVVAHPAPTPFGRATAEYDLANVGRQLGAAAVALAREQAAAMDLAAISQLAATAMRQPPAALHAASRSPLTSMVNRQRSGLVA